MYNSETIFGNVSKHILENKQLRSNDKIRVFQVVCVWCFSEHASAWKRVINMRDGRTIFSFCLHHILNFKGEKPKHLYRKQSCEVWWYFLALSHVLHEWQAVSCLKNVSLHNCWGWARLGLRDRCMEALSSPNLADWRVLLSNSSLNEQRCSGPGWVHQSSSLSLSVQNGGVLRYSLLVLNLQAWEKVIP